MKELNEGANGRPLPAERRSGSSSQGLKEKHADTVDQGMCDDDAEEVSLHDDAIEGGAALSEYRRTLREQQERAILSSVVGKSTENKWHLTLVQVVCAAIGSVLEAIIWDSSTIQERARTELRMVRGKPFIRTVPLERSRAAQRRFTRPEYVDFQASDVANAMSTRFGIEQSVADDAWSQFAKLAEGDVWKCFPGVVLRPDPGKDPEVLAIIELEGFAPQELPDRIG